MSRLTQQLFLAITLAAATSCGRTPKQPNVLFITIDTLRADRIATQMPHVAQLAGASRVDAAIAPRAKTSPSIATLLTGLPPHEHGVRDLLSPLPDKVPLLQEHLQQHGWRTGAIIGNWVLKDEHSGLARGFDVWCEDLPQVTGVPPHDAPQRTATSLVDGALAALGLGQAPKDAGPRSVLVQDDAPWFLWLHFMDPHGAYEPPHEHRLAPPAAQWISSAADTSQPERYVADYNVPAEARDATGRIDAAAVQALYDGEVRYVDAQLARLFAALAAHDLLDSTVIVITSDHGESLGEQDYWFEHGRNASEATVKVPLIVRLPAQSAWQPQLTKVAGEARLADVTPTLLEWLALPPLASLGARVDVGQSLASAWRAGAIPVLPIACEKVERAGLTGAVQTKVVRVWPWRLERRLARDAQGNLRGLSESLYNLAEDPACARDLLAQADQAGAPLAELRAELDSRVRADAGLSELGDELERRRLELLRKRPADARTIEALGY